MVSDGLSEQIRLTLIPLSSRMAAYEAVGAKTTHSTTCSCPRRSILVSPDETSHIRHV